MSSTIPVDQSLPPRYAELLENSIPVHETQQNPPPLQIRRTPGTVPVHEAQDRTIRRPRDGHFKNETQIQAPDGTQILLLSDLVW